MHDWKKGYSLTVVTGPAVEPVTPSEVADRLPGSPELPFLEVLIEGARQRVEAFLGRALVSQTLRLHLNGFPYSTIGGSVLPLPRPPLLTVDSVKYYDLDDTEKTVDTSVYTVVTHREPGAVQVKHGQHWPTDVRFDNAVFVQFQAGYGTEAKDVPRAIRNALLLDVRAAYKTSQPLSDPRISSRSVDNVSESYVSHGALLAATQGTGFTPEVLTLLEPYRVVSV